MSLELSKGYPRGRSAVLLLLLGLFFPFSVFLSFFFFLEINKKDILGLKQSCKFKTTSLHDEYSVTY